MEAAWQVGRQGLAAKVHKLRKRQQAHGRGNQRSRKRSSTGIEQVPSTTKGQQGGDGGLDASGPRITSLCVERQQRDALGCEVGTPRGIDSGARSDGEQETSVDRGGLGGGDEGGDPYTAGADFIHHVAAGRQGEVEEAQWVDLMREGTSEEMPNTAMLTCKHALL